MTASKTILIIDDDPDDRELLMEAIKETDPTIVCGTSSGSIDALQILSKDQFIVPDYIFLDMNMPRMNGKECLLEIKKIEQLNRAKIVIYTTSQREDDVTEMLDLGASFFLIKPSIFNHLKEAVRHILLHGDEKTQIEGLFQRNTKI